MLGQRIVTAVVLLALLVPAMLSSAGWPFPVLTMILVAAAGWEWARLNGAIAQVFLHDSGLASTPARTGNDPESAWYSDQNAYFSAELHPNIFPRILSFLV